MALVGAVLRAGRVGRAQYRRGDIVQIFYRSFEQVGQWQGPGSMQNTKFPYTAQPP
jgi:hypothetical protein